MRRCRPQQEDGRIKSGHDGGHNGGHDGVPRRGTCLPIVAYPIALMPHLRAMVGNRHSAYGVGMSGNRDSLVLELLRRLSAKADGLTVELRELRHRVTRVERQLAALTATQALQHAATMVRLDRLEARMDRIESDLEAPDRSAEG